MQLSLRLSAIADLVTEGNRLVDVGCDHGYLPVYLIQQKKIPSAIAMDVRKGPLSRAQEHIRQYGLEEYIQTRLSDGLEGLKAGEGDTLVIAGMGGPLMERILTDGRSVRNSFSELILQPQSDIPHFRRFIQSEGWEITEEKMVEEDGKFYPMMRVVPGENVHSSLKINVDSFQKNTSVKASSENLHADEWAEMPENPAAYTLRSLWQISSSGKEPGALPLSSAGIPDPLPDSGLNWKRHRRQRAVTARILEVKEEAQLIAAALAEYEG